MAPPAVSFWLTTSPHLLGPPVLVYAGLHVLLAQQPGTPFEQKWLRVLLYLLATPIYIYLRGTYRDLRNAALARKYGAKQLPVVAGDWPGGVDLLAKMMRTFNDEYAVNSLAEIVAKHGKTFVFRVLGEDKIFTIEPHYVKQILATNFPNYVKGEQLFGQATRSVLGTGVFNSDGDMWKFHRTLARPFFSRDRISDFEIFEKHAEEVIVKMKESFAAGRPIDFQDVCARFTLDSATDFLFGDCVRSVDEPFAKPGEADDAVDGTQAVTYSLDEPATSGFVKAFSAAQDLIGRRVRIGQAWKVFEYKEDKSKVHTDRIRLYLQPILEKGLARGKVLRARKAAGPTSPTGEKDAMMEDATFLDYLVMQTEDEDIIRDSLMNMLIAGRDTTACLLTFTTYLLSQHPEILDRVRKEVLEVIGPQKVPTYDDIRALKYMRAVFNETLRLFPPVPVDLRDSVNADVWTAQDGTRYLVPPNTTTGYGTIIMHRDEDLWGPDALQFDPNRWLDHRVKQLTANPFAFLPFNAGPRICLGQQFAYNESSFFLIRLLQSFSQITLHPEAQPKGTRPAEKDWDRTFGRNGIEKIWPRAHLTLYAQGGLWLSLQEAQDHVEHV